MHDVKFRIDQHGGGILSVDGVELQNFVRGFEVKSRAGHPAEMVLDLPPLAADGQVSIELRKLGIMMDGKLTWTTEKPNKPGKVYWWRDLDQLQFARPYIVVEKDGRLTVLDIPALHVDGIDPFTCGEWAGPLEPPV